LGIRFVFPFPFLKLYFLSFRSHVVVLREVVACITPVLFFSFLVMQE
jgi:hypothetical protein